MLAIQCFNILSKILLKNKNNGKPLQKRKIDIVT